MRAWLLFGMSASLALLGGLSCLQSTVAEDEQRIHVHGTLVFIDGKPVRNATILIVPNDQKTPQTANTDTDGNYSVQVNRCDSFDILYSHSEGGRVVVTRLSGKKEQHINKVLYDSDQAKKMSPQAAYAELQAHEYVFFAALTGEPDFRQRIASRLNEDGTEKRLSVLSDVVKETKGQAKELLNEKMKSVSGMYMTLRR